MSARPTRLRTAVVMSMNSRCPAVGEHGGPGQRVGDREAEQSRRRRAPISRNAARPIGVIGRYTPWATLKQK